MAQADVVRATIMSAVGSVINLAVLMGLGLSAEQTAGIALAVNNLMVVAFLFVKWPNGKGPHV